jgi:hypothetical protein
MQHELSRLEAVAVSRNRCHGTRVTKTNTDANSRDAGKGQPAAARPISRSAGS